MKMLSNCSRYTYGKGSNSTGGGFVVVKAETQEEKDFLQNLHRKYNQKNEACMQFGYDDYGILHYTKQVNQFGSREIDTSICKIFVRKTRRPEGGAPCDGGAFPGYEELMSSYFSGR